MNELNYSDNAGSIGAPVISNPFAGFTDLAKIAQNISANLIARQGEDTKLENVKNEYELGKELNQLKRDKLNQDAQKDQQARQDALATMRAMASMMGAKDMQDMRNKMVGIGLGDDLVDMKKVFEASNTNLDYQDRMTEQKLLEKLARLRAAQREAAGG